MCRLYVLPFFLAIKHVCDRALVMVFVLVLFRRGDMAILTPLFFVFRNYKEISGRVTIALIVNILVSSFFVILRKTPGVCDHLPSTEVIRLFVVGMNFFF